MKAITWDEELTVERRDQLIDYLANKIIKHGMASPSILFLEMHKPFAFLASQTVILGSGFLAPFVGFQKIQEYSKLMESSDNVERLVCRIEDLSAASPSSNAASTSLQKPSKNRRREL